jgi:hypothetical protein
MRELIRDESGQGLIEFVMLLILSIAAGSTASSRVK